MNFGGSSLCISNKSRAEGTAFDFFVSLIFLTCVEYLCIV